MQSMHQTQEGETLMLQLDAGAHTANTVWAKSNPGPVTQAKRPPPPPPQGQCSTGSLCETNARQSRSHVSYQLITNEDDICLNLRNFSEFVRQLSLPHPL